MKKRRKHILYIMNSILALITFISTVSAWYTMLFGVSQKDDVELGAKTNYYEAGDGTSSNPYIISQPRHLYNLAWLQDLGYYDDKVYYFKLANHIDMSSIGDIPPIGTTGYPFHGSFDGQGYVIYNVGINTTFNEFDIKPNAQAFMVSNVDRTKVFDTVTNTEEQVEALLASTNNLKTNSIGLFGEVSQLQKDDGQGLTNFYLHRSTIKCQINSIVGMLAGYVDGNMNKIGCSYSRISFASGVTGLSYGTNTDSSILSGYSLIGNYSGASGNSGTSWEEYQGTGGQGLGFGGSLDMKTLARRINYMFNTTTPINTVNNYPYARNSTYSFNALSFQAASKEFYWKFISSSSDVNRYMYLTNDSWLPINVDLSAMGLDSDEEMNNYSVNVSGTQNSNFHMNQEYLDHYSGTNGLSTGEVTASTNTGYIIGGGDTTSTAAFRVRMTSIGRIYKSVGLSSKSVYSMTKNAFESNLQFITYGTKNGTSGWYRIEDADNANATVHSSVSKATSVATASELSLDKYEKVKDNFIEMVGEPSTIYGIGFNKYLNYDSNLATTRVNTNVVINDGKSGSYTQYDAIEGAINFATVEPGKLTTVVGTYFTENDGDLSNSSYKSYRHSAFSLYKITRVPQGGNGEIGYLTSQEEITKVYECSCSEKYHINSVPSACAGNNPQVSYDSSWYSSGVNAYLPVNLAAYYFEIGLPAGEYAMGVKKYTDVRTTATDAAAGYYSGAYMMFLDIGASAGGSSSGSTSSYTSAIENIDFVSIVDTSANTPMDIFNNYTYSKVVITIKGTTTAPIAIYFKREDQNTNAPGVKYTKGESGISVTPNDSTKATEGTISF